MSYKKKLLSRAFFDRSTLIVAWELLGKFLVREVRGKHIEGMITEVEAYDGPLDRASHAHKGKTSRNEIMFGEAGNWYVYLVYGMHEMLNVVTGKEGYPAAVLVRGVDGVSGPGRLTKHFKITRALDGKPVTKKIGLWIEDRGVRVTRRQVIRTPRIGVRYAGEVWANKKYRFVLKKKKDALGNAPGAMSS